jgi:hypothetical protein
MSPRTPGAHVGTNIVRDAARLLFPKPIPTDRAELSAKVARLDAVIGDRPQQIVTETTDLFSRLRAMQGDIAERLDALRDEGRKLAGVEHERSLTIAELRAGCAREISENGPCLSWLGEWTAHVRTHVSGVDGAHDPELLRDLLRDDPRAEGRHRGVIERLRLAVARHEGALPLIEAGHRARDAIRGLQLAPVFDEDALRAIVDAVPTRCVCGDDLPTLDTFLGRAL